MRYTNLAGVRACTLTQESVSCPNAYDVRAHSGYSVKARPGDWLSFAEDGESLRYGRVLGRVQAPAIPHERYPCEPFDGIAVLALSVESLQHAFVQWVPVKNVRTVGNPPAALLAWMTGPMPRPDECHTLSHGGYISETAVGKIPEELKRIQANRRRLARLRRQGL